MSQPHKRYVTKPLLVGCHEVYVGTYYASTVYYVLVGRKKSSKNYENHFLKAPSSVTRYLGIGHVNTYMEKLEQNFVQKNGLAR